MVRWDEDGTVINPTQQVHLRVYITEIDSRYIDARGDDYVFGFLDYAFDQDLDLNPHEWWIGNTDWTGAEHQDKDGNDFGDIDYDNIAIIAAVFNNEESDSDKYSLMSAGAIAPELNITSPENNTTESGDFTLTASSSARHEEGDPTGISKVEYSVDNGTFRTLPHQSGDTYSGNVDTSDWEDGWHKIKVRSTDEQNTTNTKIIRVKFNSEDSEPPDIENISPANGSEVKGEVKISADITDKSNFSARYRIDSGNWSDLTRESGDTYSANWDSGEVKDGQHTLTIQAEDEYSNSAETSVNVDVENLKLSITSPSDNATVSNMVDIKGRIAHTADVEDAKYRVDSGEWQNMSVDGDECSADWNTRDVENGAHTLTVKVTDSIGNTEEKSVNVDVENQGEDNTPPTLTIEAPGEGANISGVFTLKAHASDENGVKSVEFRADSGDWTKLKHDSGDLYKLDWNTREVPNGDHILYFRAADTSDNLAKKQVNITVYNSQDTERPTIEAVSPVQDSLLSLASGSLKVLAHAEDNSDLKSVECRLEDGQWRTMDYDDGASNQYGKAIYSFEYTTEDEFRNLEDGTHSLSLRAEDGAGNTRQVSIQFNSDSTPPVLNMDLPAFANHTLILTGSISDNSGVEGLEVFMDNSKFYSTTSPDTHFLLTIPINSFSQGEHTLRVAATDTAGNTGNKTGMLTLDFTPPTVQITEPSAGDIIGGTVEVKVEAQDENLNIVGLKLDDSVIDVKNTGAEHSIFAFDTTKFVDGTHTLIAAAADKAGNVKQVEMTITLDNTPPEITNIQVSPAAPVEGDEITFSAAVTDNSPIKEVTLWYELCQGSTCLKAEEVDMERSGDQYTTSITTSNGTITYSIKAEDAAGNEGKSGDQTLNVSPVEGGGGNPPAENALPSGVLLTSIQPGQTVNGTILLSGAAYSARTVKVSIDGVPYMTVGTRRAPRTEKMPDFTFTDLDNHTFSISDFRGVPVILDIMFTKCSACGELGESLKVIESRYENVAIISIDGDKGEDSAMLDAYRNAHHEDWIFARDTAGISEHFGVQSFPEVIFITPDGYISGRFNGAMSVEEIEAQLGFTLSDTVWSYYLDTTGLTNGYHTITVTTDDGSESESAAIQVMNEKKGSGTGNTWLEDNMPVVGAGIIIAVAVGLVGALALKRREGAEYYCPVCESPLRYIEEYDAWYCDECEEYRDVEEEEEE